MKAEAEQQRPPEDVQATLGFEPPTELAAPSGTATEPNATAAPAALPTRQFALKAPLRLVPQVRQALQAAVATMNGDPRSAAAITVASGVFVPLSHFKANSIDISVALRALADVDMLVGTKDRRPRTYQHDIAGQEQAGVIVRPAHIQGLDPADFQAT
jgi:conjugal transfer pilus assembly protein TraI